MHDYSKLVVEIGSIRERTVFFIISHTKQPGAIVTEYNVSKRELMACFWADHGNLVVELGVKMYSPVS